MHATSIGDVASASTLAVIQRFEDALNRHDLAGVMALMTHDCVFENTFPPPGGARHEGQAAVRAALEAFFTSSGQSAFETEELFACGDRAVVRWLYRWVDAHGVTGHVRGVDVLRVRDGKVAESLAYVKG
jgi:ketosteroid isomerase-like protein